MTDKPDNQPEPSSQGAQANGEDKTLDTAETLITPATGITSEGEEASTFSTASVSGLERDRTEEIPKEPQLRFGRFVTDGTIGKGGMGVVFRAVDPLIGRTVAIKALRTDHGIGSDSRDELQSRFELEFKSAGTLSHPNIVTIYDVGQEEDITFIAMEFIDGRSLEQLLREGDVLSFELICDLIKGICAGLDFAHEAGIVHRDVKPANILIDPSKDRPKITDFGVAKVQSSGLTQTGTVIGTPAYMSPEQILGKEVSGRSDQFSAAVILYQMLTGTLPFGSDAPASILFRIVHNDPTPPHELNPDVPEQLSLAIAKALAKDPAERYETCMEMAEATSRALMGQAPLHQADEETADPSSFKSVTLSTSDPLRGSGTYAGAASWWQRQHAAPRVGLGLVGALLFAGIGWVAVANYLGRDPLPWQLPFDVPFLQPSKATSQPVNLGDSEPESMEPATEHPETAAKGGGAPSDVESRAPAPATPAPAPRTVTIASNPNGARVRLDGKILEGVTPLEVELLVGKSYEIALDLEGYKGSGITKKIEAEGDDSLFFRLAADTKPGRITFGKPPGYGSLIVDSAGRRLDPNSVAPGTYTVTIRSAANYFTSDPQRIEVREDQATQIELPPLEEIRLIGIGRGNPVVSIDGGPAISLPGNVWLQQGSSHRFSFSFEDGESRERTIVIGTTVKRIVGSPKEIKAQR